MDGVAVHTTSRTLIGRDAELTEIASLLGVRSSAGSAGSGPRSRSHVVLSGDAGVGKTRLLVELRDLAVAEGWRVVAGHCLDFGDSALPYLPVLRGARPARRPSCPRWSSGSPRPTPRWPGCSPAAGCWSRPRHARRGPGRGREPRPRRPVRRRARAARGGRRAAPLLLVIEDCHWADQSTRDLLSFLFSRPFERARWRSWRPTAPTTCTAATRSAARSPSGRGCAASSGCSSARSATTQVRLLIASLSPDAHRRGGARRDRRAAPRATRSSSRSWSAPPAQPGSWVPDDLADVLLVRLDRLNDARPPGGAAWPASPAARSPTTCSSRRPGCRPPSSRTGCARRSR